MYLLAQTANPDVAPPSPPPLPPAVAVGAEASCLRDARNGRGPVNRVLSRCWRRGGRLPRRSRWTPPPRRRRRRRRRSRWTTPSRRSLSRRSRRARRPRSSRRRRPSCRRCTTAAPNRWCWARTAARRSARARRTGGGPRSRASLTRGQIFSCGFYERIASCRASARRAAALPRAAATTTSATSTSSRRCGTTTSTAARRFCSRRRAARGAPPRDGSRRRRGHDVDIPWDESRRRRGDNLDIPRTVGPAPKFRASRPNASARASPTGRGCGRRSPRLSFFPRTIHRRGAAAIRPQGPSTSPPAPPRLVPTDHSRRLRDATATRSRR